MVNLMLLFGGKSGEFEVSLRSAYAIYKNLNKSKYNIIPVGISREGVWFFQKDLEMGDESLVLNEDQQTIVSLVPGKGFFVSGQDLSIDFVFTALHGTFCEDGTLQGLLDMAGLPYSGAGVGGSYLGIDKEIAKILCQTAGVRVVPYITLHKSEFTEASFNFNQWFKLNRKDLTFPVFVKPTRTGSSVGIYKIEDSAKLENAVKEAFKFDTKLLIESGLNVREIECAVIGNGEVEIFPPGEIIPSSDFYSYDAKYSAASDAFSRIPAQLPKELYDEIPVLIPRIYRSLELTGYARIDLFLETSTNLFYFNEVNTLPGMTSISMFPKMCESSGLNFGAMLDKIIVLGFEELKDKEELTYNLK